MKFSATAPDGVIENVIKVVLKFEKFPSKEIFVKDLTVHACISEGMYYKLPLLMLHSLLFNRSFLRIIEVGLHAGCRSCFPVLLT